MPTILEQAETIRDETVEYANTPARVGGCLVDIANALALEPAFCDAAVSGSALQTDITSAGQFEMIVVSGVVANDSNMFTVSDAGVLTYTPTDSKSRLFRITLTASMFCGTTSRLIQASIGSGTAEDSGNVISDTLPASANKQGAIVCNSVRMLNPSQTIAMWVTTFSGTESLTVTNYTAAISQVGIYSATPPP